MLAAVAGPNFIGRAVEFAAFGSDLFAVQFSILEKDKTSFISLKEAWFEVSLKIKLKVLKTLVNLLNCDRFNDL